MDKNLYAAVNKGKKTYVSPVIFPALPDRTESPWRKAEYKKRPRDNPEALTQNVKQIKLYDYWLNSPLPQTTERFDSLTDEMSERGGKNNPNHSQSTTHICVRSPKYTTIQRTVGRCDGRRL
jgi:hypothetical protein